MMIHLIIMRVNLKKIQKLARTICFFDGNVELSAAFESHSPLYLIGMFFICSDMKIKVLFCFTSTAKASNVPYDIQLSLL